MKTWSYREAENAIGYLLFDIASGFRGGNRTGDREKASAYTEAYLTVLEFAWQRGFQGVALDDTEMLPDRLMPQYFKQGKALPISPITQSQSAQHAMVNAIKKTLAAFVDKANSARVRNQTGRFSDAINEYWHVMRIGWEFGWRPTDLSESEKLPDELMPDFYRDWLASGCEK